MDVGRGPGGEEKATKWGVKKTFKGMVALNEKKPAHRSPSDMAQQLLSDQLQAEMAHQAGIINKFTRIDPRFKEIREELARRSRRRKDNNEEDIVEELYVDAHRMVSVQLGGTITDLKNIIQKSGIKLNMAEIHPGEPTDVTFVKMSKYFMSKKDDRNSLFYVNLALQISPESTVGTHVQSFFKPNNSFFFDQ